MEADSEADARDVAADEAAFEANAYVVENSLGWREPLVALVIDNRAAEQFVAEDVGNCVKEIGVLWQHEHTEILHWASDRLAIVHAKERARIGTFGWEEGRCAEAISSFDVELDERARGLRRQ